MSSWCYLVVQNGMDLDAFENEKEKKVRSRYCFNVVSFDPCIRNHNVIILTCIHLYIHGTIGKKPHRSVLQKYVREKKDGR